jgi:hypothetical protein
MRDTEQSQNDGFSQKAVASLITGFNSMRQWQKAQELHGDSDAVDSHEHAFIGAIAKQPWAQSIDLSQDPAHTPKAKVAYDESNDSMASMTALIMLKPTVPSVQVSWSQRLICQRLMFRTAMSQGRHPQETPYL